MKPKFETEDILFGILVVLFVAITFVMGGILYGKTPHPADKTLKILIPADTQYVDQQKRYSAAYKKFHPEIEIQPIPFPWANIWQKLEFMIVANIPPDVTGIEQPNLPKFVYMNAVEPLDDWIKNDPEFDPNVLYKECMDEGNWDNIQWAIPDTFSPVLLWYNKNLFDEAGLSHPTRDWTQSDVLDAAKKLTRDLDGNNIPDIWGFFTNNNHWNRYPCWIWMTGGEFMSPDMLTSSFDSPKVVAGITWLRDLALKYRVMPSSTVLGTFTSGNLFISGKLAMTTETRYALPVFYQEKNRDKVRLFKWDVCELPHEDKRATTFVCGLNLIPRTVTPERKKMAWDYIKFISSVAGQEVIAGNNAGLPARREVAERAVVHPGTPPQNDHAFLEAVSYARYLYWPFPSDPAFAEARSDLQGVWNGDLDPLPVCQKITININKSVEDFLRLNPGRKLPVKTKWVPIEKKPAASQVAAETAAPVAAPGS